MIYPSEKYRRKSIRLKGYDYSAPGGYFVTICTYKHECLFGDIVNEKMVLNGLGKIVMEEWCRSESIRAEIRLDSFIVMPNHFHGIVWIVETHGHKDGDDIVEAIGRSPLQRPNGPRPRSLSSMIAGFKSVCKIRINQIRNTPGEPVWQRGYYDHIIRNEEALNRIREYIQFNPQKWNLDRYYKEWIPHGHEPLR